LSTTTDVLPLSETVAPASVEELAERVRQACAARTPVYPLGGGTSLDFGLPARQTGIGLSLGGLDAVRDYPARDMTVTVQAGLVVAELQRLLAAENQRLPIDVAQADRATVGGVVATNFSGPRRHGWGTIRDYVIGIAAVDGVGRCFRGGGRVVKNVAGYDFCKLLTGSLGTLGVITELTFRLRPRPEQQALVACAPRDWDEAERLLAALVHSRTAPVAVELLLGPAWSGLAELDGWSASAGSPLLVVGLEGTEPEVAWMGEQLAAEWRQLGVARCRKLEGGPAEALWHRLTEFPAAGDWPLMLKITVVPSATTRLIQAALALDADCSVQAHAGSGVVVVAFSQFPAQGLSRAVTGGLAAAAAAAHGNASVLRNPSGAEMTRQCVWGGFDVPYGLMAEVKKNFDPRGILNPGRFVY